MRNREVYLAIEAPEEWPSRQAHQDLLTSIEGLGVLGAGVRDGPATLIALRLDAWNAALKNGALGPVLREIAALPQHLEVFKPLWHLQLKKAGLDGLASHALAALPPDLLRSRPTDAPQVAEMAVELEQNEIATHLLRAIDLASLPAEFLETLLN